MAWNRNRHGIRGAGARHGASGARLANSLRYLAVRLGRAERNRLQIGPHAPLERCGANIERQRIIQFLAVKLAHQCLRPGL